jgi:hypothetical protein
MAMARDFIRPKNPNFPTTHKRIRDNRRAYPHFKYCIGALDGTHIRVSLSPEYQVRYIGKTGVATQNVQYVTSTCASHMFPRDSRELCMTQVFYTMQSKLMLHSSHILTRYHVLIMIMTIFVYSNNEY